MHKQKEVLPRKVRSLLQKTAKKMFKRPFYRQDGWQEIEGKKYAEIMEANGLPLPDNFNADNLYTLPNYVPQTHTKGTLFRELKKAYVVSKNEGVKRVLTQLNEMQNLYAQNHAKNEDKDTR